MKPFPGLSALTCLLAIVAATEARAACPSRVGVGFGATIGSIAQACGVNEEALKQLNPGLNADTLRAGAVINVPPPALPSAEVRVGRSALHVQPLQVSPATGGASTSTVILPDPRPPLAPHQILRGFGDQPGQLPLPPGHSDPFSRFP